jgi:hypothetical protein
LSFHGGSEERFAVVTRAFEVEVAIEHQQTDDIDEAFTNRLK